MTYVTLGLAALIIIVGGGKKLLAAMSLKFIPAVVLLFLIIAACLIPPVRITDGVYLRLGGALFTVVCAAIGLYNGGVKRKLYTFYISLLLGVFFFVLARLFGFSGYYLFDDVGVTYVITLALSVLLFCSTTYTALSVGVLSVFTAVLLWNLGRGGEYVLFSEADTGALVLISIAAAVIVNAVRGFVLKVYPKADFTLAESAEFFEFDEPKEEQNKKRPSKN